MATSSKKPSSEKPPSADVWFDLKYWKYTLPIIYISYVIYYLINLFSIFTTIHEFNVEECVKIEGPTNFKYCEDFLLANETGVAYAACDPVKIDFNKIMGINRLVPGEPIPSGGIWKVNYNQAPANIEEFTIDDKELLRDFHPLGMKLDTHPDTGIQTLFVINLPVGSVIPSIELFTVNDKELKLTHKRSITHPEIYSPNSLHLIKDVRFRDEDGVPSFFYSNDHYFRNIILKKLENLILLWSNVGFYNARTKDVERGVKGLAFANGLAGTDDILFVSETYKRNVKQYSIETTVDSEGIPHVQLSHVKEAHFKMATDNIEYYPEKDLLVVAGHAKPFNFLRYYATKDKSIKPASEVDVWNLKTGETKVLIQDDGSLYRGSSTGAIDFETSQLIVSAVIDEGILVCDI